MTFIFRCCAAPCMALLSACAVLAPSQSLQSAPDFELAGRIVVRYQDRGFSSALRWKQASGSDEIWLAAPLGQTIAYLQADANGATLTGADQRQYRAASIESLTQSAFGWRFPVAGMRYWVLGRPATGMPLVAVERDAADRIVRLTQDEWRISFNYADAETAPSRLDIIGGGAEIRFAIDHRTAAPP